MAPGRPLPWLDPLLVRPQQQLPVGGQAMPPTPATPPPQASPPQAQPTTDPAQGQNEKNSAIAQLALAGVGLLAGIAGARQEAKRKRGKKEVNPGFGIASGIFGGLQAYQGAKATEAKQQAEAKATADERNIKIAGLIQDPAIRAKFMQERGIDVSPEDVIAREKEARTNKAIENMGPEADLYNEWRAGRLDDEEFGQIVTIKRSEEQRKTIEENMGNLPPTVVARALMESGVFKNKDEHDAFIAQEAQKQGVEIAKLYTDEAARAQLMKDLNIGTSSANEKLAANGELERQLKVATTAKTLREDKEATRIPYQMAMDLVIAGAVIPEAGPGEPNSCYSVLNKYAPVIAQRQMSKDEQANLGYIVEAAVLWQKFGNDTSLFGKGVTNMMDNAIGGVLQTAFGKTPDREVAVAFHGSSAPLINKVHNGQGITKAELDAFIIGQCDKYGLITPEQRRSLGTMIGNCAATFLKAE